MNTLHRYAVRIEYRLRVVWSYLNGSRARRDREWQALRAEHIRLNRSNGARKAWETRRAREAKARADKALELYRDDESDAAFV